MNDLSVADVQFLLDRPEFLRFIYQVIQTSGYIGIDAGADGRSVQNSNLNWIEGRRSLGHEILLMMEEGTPAVLRSPDGAPLAALNAVIREAMNPKPTKEKAHDD